MEDNWISITDKLPEKSMNVLVSTSCDLVGFMFYSDQYGFHKLKDNQQVLYWMTPPNPVITKNNTDGRK
jgi:hypothetical protein